VVQSSVSVGNRYCCMGIHHIGKLEQSEGIAMVSEAGPRRRSHANLVVGFLTVLVSGICFVLPGCSTVSTGAEDVRFRPGKTAFSVDEPIEVVMIFPERTRGELDLSKIDVMFRIRSKEPGRYGHGGGMAYAPAPEWLSPSCGDAPVGHVPRELKLFEKCGQRMVIDVPGDYAVTLCVTVSSRTFAGACEFRVVEKK